MRDTTLWLRHCYLCIFSHKNRTVCWRCVHCNRWQIACIGSSKIYSSWVCALCPSEEVATRFFHNNFYKSARFSWCLVCNFAASEY